ncbi:hypothetical protein LK542_21990 [Massilia sp. IC2-477]|uniref:hypothetical protein n=1 Tax=Massilia sp. IC2-477 TaxID=2887198 RepID=UPI001D10F20B|nr:hypothetical protein [Massilia sp. IC2-477]MCC2958294.1 hypothetical protein [Massilia sp. IC2-477]
MSIAVTVVIAPSRCLRCLLAGFGASLIAAACAVGLVAPAGYAGGPLVALAPLIAGLCVAHAALRPAMVHRIDISGPGQIRLTVQQGVRPERRAALPAVLLPGSTLWPRLMLLRLGTGRRASGRAACCTVPVLPDSLAPDAFRALVVALGAGAETADRATLEHKIL